MKNAIENLVQSIISGIKLLFISDHYLNFLCKLTIVVERFFVANSYAFFLRT